MVADYYAHNILPEEPYSPEVDDDISTFGGVATISNAIISYTGTKPTVKVGGSFKTFTAAFSNDGVTAKSWVVVDGVNDITSSTEDYTIEYDSNNNLRLKVAKIGSLNVYKVPSLTEKTEDNFEQFKKDAGILDDGNIPFNIYNPHLLLLFLFLALLLLLFVLLFLSLPLLFHLLFLDVLHSISFLCEAGCLFAFACLTRWLYYPIVSVLKKGLIFKSSS